MYSGCVLVHPFEDPHNPASNLGHRRFKPQGRWKLGQARSKSRCYYWTGPDPAAKHLFCSSLLGPSTFGLGHIWGRACLGPGPFGPGPVWTRARLGLGPFGPRASLGPGPFGPRPIWACAHLGPGPVGPRPIWPGPISLSGPIPKIVCVPVPMPIPMPGPILMPTAIAYEGP